MVAIDETTWESVKAELVVMWQIVVDCQNNYRSKSGFLFECRVKGELYGRASAGVLDSYS